MQVRALHASVPTQLRNASKTRERKQSKTLNLEEAFHGLSLQNPPTPESLSKVLDLCASKEALFQGRQIHSKIVASGLFYDDEDEFLATKLTFMYGKCCCILSAQQLFDKMSHRSIFAWNALIGAYSSLEGHQQKALGLYQSLREAGVSPDGCTIATLMKSCGALGDLRLGSEAHGFALKSGHLSSSFVHNSILSMYAKCDCFELASRIFRELPEKEDIVSWNAIVAASVQSEKWSEALRFFSEMQEAGVGLNSYTAVSVLQACKELCLLDLGRELHAFLVKSAQQSEIFAANALLVMYAGCGEMDSSLKVFRAMTHKDIVSWNSLIAGFLLNDLHHEVISHFLKMPEPDKASLVTVASSLGQSGESTRGKEVHAYAIRRALDDDLQVRNTLINMYARCSCGKHAENVFNSIPEKDHITWTGMISAHLQSRRYREAVNTFKEAVVGGAEADPMLLVAVLKALICLQKEALMPVKEVHAYVIRAGLSDRILENMFVDAYGTCGEITHSMTVFRGMKSKDVVSFTSILNACAHNGNFTEAMELIYLFKESRLKLDAAALVSYLGVIGELSSLRKGKESHALGVRLGFADNPLVVNSLADMYARCGDLRTCRRIFDLTESKDLILWTALIDAYGMHGKGEEAVALYQEMLSKGIVPDHVCFLAVLYACSHAGLVKEGMAYVDLMKEEYKLEPWVEHHVCVVDMLSRSGKVDAAYNFITRTGNEDASLTPAVWSALLGGCRVYSNGEVGRVAVKRLMEVDPDRAANYVLAANLLAGEKKWKEVDMMRMRMKEKGLKKNPACSWIEMGEKVHTFVAGDRAHPLSAEVHSKLEEITRELEGRFGYKRDTRFVLKDVMEDEKAESLSGHSERLAVTLGLIGGTVGPIRVMKNLRVCGDCHVFCKLVSKMFEREVVLRDASRFHHFKDGSCTCGEFW